VEPIFTHPAVEVFVLVTGDSDYSPLIRRPREYGKWVVGVGTEANASRLLVSVCSEYKFWGTLVAQVDPAAQPAITAAFDIDAARHSVTSSAASLTWSSRSASPPVTSLSAGPPAATPRELAQKPAGSS
jgi:NYN domain